EINEAEIRVEINDVRLPSPITSSLQSLSVPRHLILYIQARQRLRKDISTTRCNHQVSLLLDRQASRLLDHRRIESLLKVNQCLSLELQPPRNALSLYASHP